MNNWPFYVPSITQDEIYVYIRNPAWQKFRLSLKGLPTEVKLEHLAQLPRDSRAQEVRIANYINALKRGGQLDMNLNVVR